MNNQGKVKIPAGLFYMRQVGYQTHPVLEDLIINFGEKINYQKNESFDIVRYLPRVVYHFLRYTFDFLPPSYSAASFLKVTAGSRTLADE